MDINGSGINEAGINEAGDVAFNPRRKLNLRWQFRVLTAQTYPLGIRFNLAGTVSGPLDVPAGLIVDAAFEHRANLSVDADFEWSAPWGLDTAFEYPMQLLEGVDASVTYQWDLKATDSVDAAFDYPAQLGLTAFWEYPTALLGVVEAPVAYPAELLSTVEAARTYHMPLNPVDVVEAPVRYLWALQDDAGVLVQNTVTFVHTDTGRQVPLRGATLEMAEGDFAWKANVELANLEDLALFTYSTRADLTINGETWAMIVDQKDRSRSTPSVVQARLRLIGSGALYDTPRTDPVTYTVTVPTLAKDVVEALLGVSVTWNIVNWLIPANRFGVERSSPVKAATQVVEAVGGLLETLPDGTWVARSRYPVSTKDYATATPDEVYLETDAILSTREGYQGGGVTNLIRIRDTAEGSFSDRIEFEVDDGNPFAGTLYVYPAPFRDITVEHTSDGDINLIPLAEELVEHTQEVEFRGGQVDVQYPIDSVVSIEWFDLDLDPVTFEQGSTTLSTAVGEGYSLATVVYRARAKRYRTTSSKDDRVQYLVRDSEA